ncbi:MAG TPA: Gfo/Idh/MocA family oxidoreductase [Verrucomicrobiae bacterium]|nr:Gfo/Idh/MocA family oxidoreductase [Verrucomicrobiae bacterium]
MLNEKEIGVAFIGAGIVAEMHGRGLAATGGARFVGVYDPVASQAKKIAKKFGGRVYKNLDELLRDKSVCAAHVLTPTRHHVPAALEALQAGKHVLVEKPVALTVAEIGQLQAAAKKCGRVCMPAHNYIYVPSLKRGRRLISEKKLGRIAALWILYNIYHSEKIAAQCGAGVLRAICIHHAYSLLYLLGRPVRVLATVSNAAHKTLNFEDQAAITCEFAAGTIAHLWCSFAVDDPTNDPWTVIYKVLGERGGLTYSWNEAQFDDRGGPAWGLPCYEDGFRGEIDHFINQVIRRNAEPLSTLDDAADALRIIEAAERSAAGGKRERVEYE